MCKAAEAGLEPGRKNTGITKRTSSPGQFLAGFDSETVPVFAELLRTEYGMFPCRSGRTGSGGIKNLIL